MTADQARWRKVLAKWHRRLALGAVAWLAILAATGLAVNHANDWGLDRKPLPGKLHSGLYRIGVSERNHCPPAVDAAGYCDQLFAEFDFGEIHVLLGPERLLMLDAGGRLIESMPAATLGLRRIEAGFSTGRDLFLRDDERTIHTDADLLEWRALGPGEYSQQESWDWRSASDSVADVTWERLLLDVHAARFLGPFAQAFTDLMAGLTLLLALSGVWLYLLKRSRNGREIGGPAGDSGSVQGRDRGPEADR
jgi:hypothetical protein